MNIKFKKILILADIEGSSGCLNYKASSFMTREWAAACVDMSKDINAVIESLFQAGVEKVIVKDFHRTGYNLLPELIDKRAELQSGYIKGPVPGIGDPGDLSAIMMIGMHSSAGSGGFLSHTLTSRISELSVNGKQMSEAELFSASVAAYNIKPIFFSGCPIACKQTENVIKNIDTYKIDKSDITKFNKERWRSGLAKAAVQSLRNSSVELYLPDGPFNAVISIRKGEDSAKKLAKRWGFGYKENKIFFESDNIHTFYRSLIQLCYLTPFIEKILPLALLLYNIAGRIGQAWVRRKINAI